MSEYTIEATAKHLKRLSQHANLSDPQQVTQYVSNLKVSNGYKINLYKAYRHLAKFYNIPFTMPKLRAEAKAVTIPTLEKLNAFINYARKGLALKLRISKYGLRPIEVVTLKAKDIDTDHKTITPTTAKKGTPRTVPIDDTPLMENSKPKYKEENSNQTTTYSHPKQNTTAKHS
jgi:integrase